MVNNTGTDSRQSQKPPRQKKPFGFWDFLTPTIIGAVLYLIVSTLMQTTTDRPMSPGTFYGGPGVLVLIVVIILLFVAPISSLFISPRVGLKLMLVMWPTDAYLIFLVAWVINNVKMPI